MPQSHPPLAGHALGLPLAVDDNGEPRVFDIHLAKALGFERPRKIRELIDRKQDELRSFGHLASVALDDFGQPLGGRPTVGLPPAADAAPPVAGCRTGFVLNEKQVILLAILSDAPRAAEVRHQVVEVFAAWRAGLAAPVQNPEGDDVDLIAGMGEADRLADTDLAAVLGFANPFGLRLAITRYEEELRERGELRRYSLNRATRGRPQIVFLLNRPQCQFLDGACLPPAAAPVPSPHVNVLASPVRARAVFHQPGEVDVPAIEAPRPAAAPAADPVAETLALLTAKMLRQDEEIAALKARPAVSAPVRPAEAARLAPSEADALDLFIAGCTAENRTAKVRSSDLFAAWCEFCRLSGITPGSVGWFGGQMNARGFRWIKASAIYYIGFDLLPSPSWSDTGLFGRDGGAA